MKNRQRKYSTSKPRFQRAFSDAGADSSLWYGLYTEDGGEALRASPLFETSLGKPSKKEPLGYGEGLSSRLSLLEGVIHDLAITGNSEGLYRALEEYSCLWVELARRGSC